MADRFHISERLQWSRRAMLALAGSAAAIGTMTANTAKSAQTQEKMQMGDNREIEQIYQRWDNALCKKDLEAALALYADDASIESPLVQHLLKTSRGVVQGKDNLRQFITLVFQTSPGAEAISYRLFHRRPRCDVGVSACDARGRADGSR